MEPLLHLKAIWEKSRIRAEWTASEADLLRFEAIHNIRLPEDFRSYFMLVNGMDNAVDAGFYEFYSLDKIENVPTRLGDYHGIPKHSAILPQLERPENCFVFADYSISLFVYAIRLTNLTTSKNEVYTICGDKHKIIAQSFSEFIKLYLQDSNNLTF